MSRIPQSLPCRKSGKFSPLTDRVVGGEGGEDIRDDSDPLSKSFFAGSRQEQF